MRVAINALHLQEPATEAERRHWRYLYYLLEALGQVDGINEYLALSPRKVEQTPDAPSTFQWEVAPLGGPAQGERVQKFVWEQVGFPAAANRGGVDLAHIPYFAPVYRQMGIPQVVTIPDVIALALPEYRASPGGQVYTQMLSQAARKADSIITMSEWSKGEIMDYLRVPEERITVIREAAAPTFTRVVDPERLRAVRAKYGLGQRFVLNTGGIDVRKNVERLVGAFAAVYHELREPELQLFIDGDCSRLGSSPLYPDWRPLASSVRVARQIVCAQIAEEDRAAVYSAASCFAFTSWYEGFGVTPLEAMACGAPVVCSSATSLPEAVGSAGILVNPSNTDEIGAAIYRALAASELNADLRARGLAHSKQFTWRKTAVATSALYAAVAGIGRDE